MKKYAIKEIFYTVQGEGYHAGTFALFIRFAGCNMWSGLEKDRERDATRNEAECPKWCDTDFVGGELMTHAEILCVINDDPPPENLPLIVLTGGEPFLQVDVPFIEMLRAAAPLATIAVETNGTVLPKLPFGTRHGIDWVCVSPKVSPDKLKLKYGHELKVVYPAYNPLDYEKLAQSFHHAYVSAEAETTGVGQSLIKKDNLQRAAAFVMEHPMWKLTLQSHKIIGMP